MRRRREPAIATWLLKLFSSSAEHESVIGDLLEQYQRGRGRFWYWRQAIGIVVLRLYREGRQLSIKGIAVRQGVGLILFSAALAAVLLTDIWLLFLVGILGGLIAGVLIFWLGNHQSEPAKADRIYTHQADPVRNHPGISIHHIPVEGAVGLLFVLATFLIFGGGIPAVRQILVITVPMGILGLGILVYWHRHHPLKIQALDLHQHKHRQ
jgi:hypothetical protein